MKQKGNLLSNRLICDNNKMIIYDNFGNSITKPFEYIIIYYWKIKPYGNGFILNNDTYICPL